MKEVNAFVRINTVKYGDTDKYILTTGTYQLFHKVFDTEEEAENFYAENGISEENIEQIIVFSRLSRDIEKWEKQSKKNKKE